MFVQPVVPLEEKVSHCHVTPVTPPSGSDNVAVTVSPTVRPRRRQAHPARLVFRL